jgi:predicted DNA-binding transcriptional regulator YafY
LKDENEQDAISPGTFGVSNNEEEGYEVDLQGTFQRKGLKHEAAERIFRLLQFLTANQCTRKEIFKHLASYYKIDAAVPGEATASRSANRMFERDIKFLEEQGFEIRKVRKRGQPAQYSLVRGTGPRTTFLFTESEVDSLALLYNLFADPARYAQADPTHPLPLQPPRNPFAEEILSLIEKLVSVLPAEQKRHFDRWVRKPYIYFNLAPVTDYLPHRVTIDTIVRAISFRQQIRFDYMPTHREQDVIPHEHIDPYYIAHMEGHFYLIGYSHKTTQFLEYRIDRIKSETIKIGPDTIDIGHRRRPIEFRFWIDSSIARHGLSQRWLTQTTEREEAYLDEHGNQRRRILVRATAYNEWRVRQQLLRYGEQAELVEPQWLREKMKKTVERMYKLYEDNND